MAIKLKQSTASQEIPLGYFVDDDDGNTEMTGLTIANTDIKLWKTGATTLANKNSGGATHIANGIYYCVLDATDTNTLGSMVVFVHVAGALACRVECEVLAANVYDSLVGGGDLLDVNASQVGGQTASAAGTVTFPGTIASTTNITAGTVTTATNVTTVNGLANNVITANSIATGAITNAKFASGAIDAAAIADNAIDAGAIASNAITDAKIATGAITAAKIAGDAITNAKIADNAFGPEQFTATMLARMGVIGSGTAQSASSTGVVLASADAYADDVLIGCTIMVFGSTQGYWQSRLITDNALSGDTVTVDTWTVTPSGTITYIIIGTPKASSTQPVPASLSSTELAKFFLTDTGETYGDAVSGSVVKEIADNASGGGGGGADAMLLQSTTIATLASQTSFTLTAGSADDDAYNGAMLICTDQSTAVQKCVGLISDYTGSSRTVTLAASPGIFTMATGDAIKIYAQPKQLPNALTGAAGGLVTAGTGTAQLSTSSGLVTLAGVTHTGAVIPTVTTTTTATNLTNAPTNGDFTATMKTSIGTAVAASAVASVTGNVGGTVNGLTSTAQGNVRTAVGLDSANMDTQFGTLATASALSTADGKLDTLVGRDSVVVKNVAKSNFSFAMQLADGTPGTGLTVSGQIAKDGGSFSNLTNSVSEIAAGWYKVNLTQAEMNADVVALKFTATGAKQANIAILTQS